jgi:hypothetical protein
MLPKPCASFSRLTVFLIIFLTPPGVLIQINLVTDSPAKGDLTEKTTKPAASTVVDLTDKGYDSPPDTP